jgi:hypothetical protein
MFSEQDVDRELKAALSVSPSPDFETRVLRQVEADRPSRVGMFSVARGLKFSVARGLKTAGLQTAGLQTAGLPIAASIVIAAGLFYAMNRTPVVVAPATPPGVARTEPRPAPVQSLTRTEAKSTGNQHVARVRPPVRAARTATADVVVPVNQMEAVRRLVDAVNAGRIAAPTEPVAASVGLPKEVVVAPLSVEPIPVPALTPDAETPSPIIRGQ